ncbi:hypothetical protein DM02DRAFT_630267 [Periconia macrospinosa]|uniref:Uncharacterized protein n=1 Tax=Periconia macrospinosa TaxID=97972 RepID=A0A2V1DKE7_9PLEO|nr:hypothetical protein DM02DRAFT_630267 [Periconia macrospinosa]
MSNNYVNQATQTIIQGLAHDPAPRPPSLLPSYVPANTATPPEEADTMAMDKMQLSNEPSLSVNQSNSLAIPKFYPNPAKILRKQSRPRLETRISMPEVTQYDLETPLSPPPTEIAMSPLPAANRLHAGHTPIIPRARSPLPDVSSPVTPDQDPDDDQGLTGPLTLPPRPGDGTEETIPLHVLDAQLERLRVEQETNSAGHVLASPASVDTTSPRSPTAHDIEAVDGVLLKKPRINFGAPLGQA